MVLNGDVEKLPQWELDGAERDLAYHGGGELPEHLLADVVVRAEHLVDHLEDVHVGVAGRARVLLGHVDGHAHATRGRVAHVDGKAIGHIAVDVLAVGVVLQVRLGRLVDGEEGRARRRTLEQSGRHRQGKVTEPDELGGT